MTKSLVEFASSQNGDRWFFGQKEDEGGAYVLHKANAPSGGAETRTELGKFLKVGANSPEHDALLRFIGSLYIGEVPRGEQSDEVVKLRRASEDEVSKALDGAKVALPLTTTYEALEFFNCMLDVLTSQRENDEADGRLRIAPGFGSTH